MTGCEALDERDQVAEIAAARRRARRQHVAPPRARRRFVVARPTTRGECIAGPRPCPWLNCRQPKDLPHAFANGPNNDAHIERAFAACNAIICGWGASIPKARRAGREQRVMELLGDRQACCLKINADGSPAHPLYLRGDLPRIPYGGT